MRKVRLGTELFSTNEFRTLTMKPKWLVLEGDAQLNKGEILFAPSIVDSDKEDEEANYRWSSVGSDIYFHSGEIIFSAQIKSPTDKIQVLLNSHNQGVIIAGINVGMNSYGIAERRGGVKQDLVVSGRRNNPPINEWLKLRISYIGSTIELFINDVSIGSARVNLHNTQIHVAYRGKEPATVKDIEIIANRPQAFVVMQFTDTYDALFNEVIVPVCEEYGYEVIRADDMYTTGLIIEDITRAIRDSSLVIADITPNNPNVYYEVGYAHGIKKSTVLLSNKDREKIPFDISGFRVLFYENTIAGKPNVENALRKHLRAIINE